MSVTERDRDTAASAALAERPGALVRRSAVSTQPSTASGGNAIPSPFGEAAPDPGDGKRDSVRRSMVGKWHSWHTRHRPWRNRRGALA